MFNLEYHHQDVWKFFYRSYGFFKNVRFALSGKDLGGGK